VLNFCNRDRDEVRAGRIDETGNQKRQLFFCLGVGVGIDTRVNNDSQVISKFAFNGGRGMQIFTLAFNSLLKWKWPDASEMPN